jgi:hypothetical protein
MGICGHTVRFLVRTGGKGGLQMIKILGEINNEFIMELYLMNRAMPERQAPLNEGHSDLQLFPQYQEPAYLFVSGPMHSEITKGTENQLPDEKIVHQDNVLGKVVFHMAGFSAIYRKKGKRFLKC